MLKLLVANDHEMMLCFKIIQGYFLFDLRIEFIFFLFYYFFYYGLNMLRDQTCRFHIRKEEIAVLNALALYCFGTQNNDVLCFTA